MHLWGQAAHAICASRGVYDEVDGEERLRVGSPSRVGRAWREGSARSASHSVEGSWGLRESPRTRGFPSKPQGELYTPLGALPTGSATR